jgi:hypothetical protein
MISVPYFRIFLPDFGKIWFKISEDKSTVKCEFLRKSPQGYPYMYYGRKSNHSCSCACKLKAYDNHKAKLCDKVFNTNLMCSMSVHYIIQKIFKHQRMHKEFFSSIITHSYMFRPCWVIFREKPFVFVTLGCTTQLSENVLLTVHCAVYGGVNSLWSRLLIHHSVTF